MSREHDYRHILLAREFPGPHTRTVLIEEELVGEKLRDQTTFEVLDSNLRSRGTEAKCALGKLNLCISETCIAQPLRES
jgi:hypothetical protein